MGKRYRVNTGVGCDFRYCVNPAHYNPSGNHTGGQGHVWVDLMLILPGILNFDETQVNGPLIETLAEEHVAQGHMEKLTDG